MITIGEEIYLLLVDYDTGWMNSELPVNSRRNALSGAVLMELALLDKIDTDLEYLYVLDRTPSGERVLDAALRKISKKNEHKPVDYWVAKFSKSYDKFEKMCIGRLEERGVAFRGKCGRIWITGQSWKADDAANPWRGVRLRLADELLKDEVPGPRDTMIIAIADACDLWQSLLDEDVLELVRPKIDKYSKLDLIGQAVVRAIESDQPDDRDVLAC